MTSFEPNFIITPQIATALTRIEAAKEAVSHFPITTSVPASLRETTRLYATHDANYDTTALINTSGAAVERYQYDPYGNVTYLNPSTWASTSSSYSWSYLFQGGRLDSSVQMYNFQAREYNPTLGRWVQANPAGYVNGPNRYQFAMSNPVGMVDPGGLDAVDSGDSSDGSDGSYVLNSSFFQGLGPPTGMGLFGAAGAGQFSSAAGSTYYDRPIPMTSAEQAEFNLLHIQGYDPQTANWRSDVGGWGYAPVLGHGMQTIYDIGYAGHDFGRGDYTSAALEAGSAVANGVNTITDALLLKALYNGVVSGATKLFSEAAAEGSVVQTADRQALNSLIKEATNGGRTPLSVKDANTVLDWAEEQKILNVRAGPGDVGVPSNWNAFPDQPHIHIPNTGIGNHIPVEPGVAPR